MQNKIIKTIVALILVFITVELQGGFDPVPKQANRHPVSQNDFGQAPPASPAEVQPEQSPAIEQQNAVNEPLRIIGSLVNEPEYISRIMVTEIDASQIGQWQVREISGKTSRITPVIVADNGFELNLSELTASFEGEGALYAAIIYYASNDLEQAIEKNSITSFRKLNSDKSVSYANRYKGGKFAWVVLAAEGRIKLTGLKHSCNLVQGGLYGHVAREYRFESGSLRYRIMYPKNYDPSKKYPLVISGPSSGGVGSDNSKNMEMVTLARFLYTNYYNDPAFECFSIVPQIPDNASIPAPYYPNGSKGLYDRTYHPAANLSAVNATGWYAQATLALVREMLESDELSIDPARVYFTGFSYGGKACWEFLKAAPEMFAGIISCGGWPIGMPYQAPNDVQFERLKKEVAGYKHVPVYITAGEKDGMRLGSKVVHEEIIRQGGKSIYKEISGADHVQSAGKTWADRSIIQWLFEQKKDQL